MDLIKKIKLKSHFFRPSIFPALENLRKRKTKIKAKKEYVISKNICASKLVLRFNLFCDLAKICNF